MDLNKIYKIVDRYGFILTNDADEILREYYYLIKEKEFINFLSKHRELFINRDDIEKLVKKRLDKIKYEEIIEDIKILYNPGERISKGTGINEYLNMFNYRYTILEQHIRKLMKVGRIDSISALPLRKNIGGQEEAYIIGIVYSKKIWDNKILVELEDRSGRQRIFAFKNSNPKAYIELAETPLDAVIGVHISIAPSGLYIAKEIFYPSVKSLNNRSKEEVYAVLTSDIHVGSVKFLEDKFKEFIRIINGYTDNYQLKKITEKIRYIIIAGDIVEGVGVFPEQKKELNIDSIEEQYKEAYALLSKIKKDKRIIIIPGNHDASRRSLPQPPIFEEYAKKFYEDERFYMLGNPVNISLHSVNIYIYHGDFLQDIFMSTPGISRDNIKKAVSIILRYRHAAPTYGLNTLIAPEKIDMLILPEKIDIIHMGHTHKLFIGRINGILSINSGTWQEQTNYQKLYGIVPDPLKVPIINLKTLKSFLLDLTY